MEAKDNEIEALASVIVLFEQMDSDARVRVIGYVTNRFGIHPNIKAR